MGSDMIFAIPSRSLSILMTMLRSNSKYQARPLSTVTGLADSVYLWNQQGLNTETIFSINSLRKGSGPKRLSKSGRSLHLRKHRTVAPETAPEPRRRQHGNDHHSSRGLLFCRSHTTSRPSRAFDSYRRSKQEVTKNRSWAPRPAARASAAIRFIPNDLRNQNRLPTRADGPARSEFERAVRS